MKKKVRILIADDHDIVRRGMKPLIESEWGWEICGEACDGREAVALAEKLKPDLVVLDVTMPKLNGIDATRQIKRVLPDTEIMVFTGSESEALVHELFAAGARGCVLKSEAAAHLIPAIKALCEHRPYLASHVSQIVFESYLKGGGESEKSVAGGLSPREREVVQLLADGKSNKEVASALGISVKTAETHRAAVWASPPSASWSATRCAIKSCSRSSAVAQAGCLRHDSRGKTGAEYGFPGRAAARWRLHPSSCK
jgi:DNA-binding NarL/FixJ family response regulator